MSKILACTLPFPGHLYPAMPVLVELGSHGHDVVILTFGIGLSIAASAKIRSADLLAEFSAVEVGQYAAPTRRSQAFSMRGFHIAEALEAAISKEKPDLLMIDPTLWGASVAAEASGLPWCTLAHNSCWIPSVGARPLGPGFRPPRNLAQRICHSIIAHSISIANGRKYLPAINALRGSRNLPAVPDIQTVRSRAPLALAFTTEPFEYPRTDWHSSVRFVGPSLWEPQAAQVVGVSPFDSRPLVLVCTSSVRQSDTKLVANTLSGLADAPFQVLVSGRDANRHALPPNARAVGLVRHTALMPHAACVVCHGGMGVTQKALAAGVPVVAVPYARDQFETARRVEVAEAGVRLSSSRLTGSRLRDAVNRALQLRDGANRIAAIFRLYDCGKLGARAVEQLLGAIPSSHKVLANGEP